MKKRFFLFTMGLIVSSFSFAQNWVYNSPANTVTVTSDTKVGVGITNPSCQFHLYNSIRPEFYIGNPYGALRLAVAYNAGEYAPTSQRGDVVYNLHGVDIGDNHVGLIYNFNNNDNDGASYIKFCDWTNHDIMAIYNNATVKIDGKLFAKEIEVKTNVWADFVFKPDYTLMPLSELEHFIKQNNHLPDVPTETQVKENGINVAEMNAKLLQKIEELTLYVIEQQKQIDELKSK